MFHRTSIAEAREIVQQGFLDEKWAFHVLDGEGSRPVKLAGVWLSDRPLSEDEGPDGDAVLEVELGLPEESLGRFELENVFWDARLWVIPSRLLNAHARVRIHGVDPRSSWFYEAADDEPEDADEGWSEDDGSGPGV